MNKREMAFYKKLSASPQKDNDELGKRVLSAASAEQFSNWRKLREVRHSMVSPVNAVLREFMRVTPQFAPVVTAIKNRPKAGHLVRPLLAAPPQLKAPLLHFGSVELIDPPPFDINSDWTVSGDKGNSKPPSVNKDGAMSLTLQPGLQGSGTVDAWAAVGHSYVVPPDLVQSNFPMAWVDFTAVISYSFGAIWSSQMFEQAAGNLSIVVSVDQMTKEANGDWKPTTVGVSIIDLVSFNDYNISDTNNKSEKVTSQCISTSGLVSEACIYVGLKSSAVRAQV